MWPARRYHGGLYIQTLNWMLAHPPPPVVRMIYRSLSLLHTHNCYTRTYAYTHLLTHVHTSIRTHVHTQIFPYTWHKHTQARTHAQLYMRQKHVHTHSHLYVQLQNPLMQADAHKCARPYPHTRTNEHTQTRTYAKNTCICTHARTNTHTRNYLFATILVCHNTYARTHVLTHTHAYLNMLAHKN
jgi:hypothetical protein